MNKLAEALHARCLEPWKSQPASVSINHGPEAHLELAESLEQLPPPPCHCGAPWAEHDAHYPERPK